MPMILSQITGRLTRASQITGVRVGKVPANQLYLHCDGCLLGHGLVCANESHVVIQVVDGTLGSKQASKKGQSASWAKGGLEPPVSCKHPPPLTDQNVLDGNDRTRKGCG